VKPLRRSGKLHHACLYLVYVHQMALPLTDDGICLIAAYYSSIDPEGMKGWVGLVGWPTADGLPIWVVTHQLQVEPRTGKVHLSKTNVLPPHHVWCTTLYPWSCSLAGFWLRAVELEIGDSANFSVSSNNHYF